MNQLLQGLRSKEFYEKVVQEGDMCTLEEVLVCLESLEQGSTDKTWCTSS